MAIEKEQWSSLASYLNGQSTEAEKVSVEKWIETSEENRAIFQEAEKIWNRAGVRLPYPDIDSAQLLADIKSKISAEPKHAKLISLLDRPALKIAASLIVILIVSYFLIRKAPGENIAINSGDQVVTVYLPDSSKVWLNVNSQITYSRKFNPREVKLSGEAFLMVRKDSGDFVVTNDHTITRVMGTSFNLKEESDTMVILTVEEGVVEFSKRDSGEKETVVVKADEKGVFKKKSALTREKNNNPSFAQWREQNNPTFQQEKNNPAGFLSTNYSWRKNRINQSVIEGTLFNNASLAAYTKIVLQVTYTKPNGTTGNVDLTINETVYAGKKLEYKRRLLDLFSDTKSVVVKIKSANVKTTNTF
jgi:transmembrane sensor